MRGWRCQLRCSLVHSGWSSLCPSLDLRARREWQVVPSLGLFVVGLPVYYQQVQRACVDPVTCSLGGAQTAKGLQDLSAHGLSVSAYAALFTIFFAIMAATWCTVGFLLFWRRSDD